MKKGEAFEQFVEGVLIRDGLRLVSKVEPCPKIIRPLGRGQFVVTFSAGGILDFAGCWEGRYVEFDAKDIKGTRLTFSRYFERSQLDRIAVLLQEQALVGVIVRFRGETANDDRIICIPGAMIAWLILEGKKGLSLADVENHPSCFRLNYGNTGGVINFLSSLKT